MEGTGESKNIGLFAPVESLRTGIDNEIHKIWFQIFTFTQEYLTQEERDPEPWFLDQINTLRGCIETCHDAQSHLRGTLNSIQKYENVAAPIVLSYHLDRLEGMLRDLNQIVETFDDSFRVLRCEIGLLSAEEEQVLYTSENLNRMVHVVEAFKRECAVLDSTS